METRTSSPVTLPSAGLVVLNRVLEVPRRLVFDAWTQAGHLKRWWGPKSFSAPFCEIDLRVGGVFRYCMRSADGAEYWGRGIYRDIVPPERLVYADTFTDPDGNPVPPSYYGLSDETTSESLVTLRFARQQSATSLTLRHSNIAEMDQERDMLLKGWSEMLDKLEGYLARARS